MNYLERKTMETVVGKFTKAMNVVGNIQYQLENCLDPKKNNQNTLKVAIQRLEDLQMSKLHEIREWLFALQKNDTNK